jgi:hypothetical protein
MPITLPTSVAPNELIQSAWGNSVVNALDELDDEKMGTEGGLFSGQVSVSVAAPVSPSHLTRKDYVDLMVPLLGGAMTGQLSIDSPTSRALVALSTTDVTIAVGPTDADDQAGVGFFGTATSPSSLGSRTGFVGQTGGADVHLRAEAAGGDIVLSALNDIVFRPDDTERFRIAGTSFLFGKTAPDLNNEGVEIFGTGSAAIGSVRSTIEDASIQNVYCRHMAAADANGEDFVQFARSSAGTVIGSIDQNSTTGVNYNTTSDARLKTDVGLVDDDGLATIEQVEIHRYEHVDDEGTTQLGVFAQELVDVIPEAVRVGGDDVASDPWLVGYGNQNIVSHLILAVQQLSARVAELEGQ